MPTTEIRMAPNGATDQAVRTALANGGSLAPSREQAVEILKQRGITQGADGRPVFSQPAPKPADYAPDLAALRPNNVEDTAGAVAGGQNLAAALGLPGYLGRSVIRGLIESGDIDPAVTEAWLTRAGYDPTALIGKVDALVEKAGPAFAKVVRAKDLPAQVLLQLAVFADHQGKQK